MTQNLTNNTPNISFTRHYFEERLNLKTNKKNISKNRAIHGINEGVINDIIKPYIFRIQKRFGKYLFKIQMDKKTNKNVYFVIASEANMSFVVVTSLSSEREGVKFNRMPLENKIFIDNLFLEDLIEKYKDVVFENKINYNFVDNDEKPKKAKIDKTRYNAPMEQIITHTVAEPISIHSEPAGVKKTVQQPVFQKTVLKINKKNIKH